MSIGDAAHVLGCAIPRKAGVCGGSGRGAIAALFRRAFGNLPRAESWLPYIFTSIDDPSLDQIIEAEFTPVVRNPG